MLSNATATSNRSDERRTPAPPPSDVPPLRLPGPPRAPGRRRAAAAGRAGPAKSEKAQRGTARAREQISLDSRMPSRCGAPGRRYFNKTTNLRLPFKVNLRALRYRKRSDLFRRTYRLLPGPRLARAPTRGFYDGRVRRRSASGPARRRSAAAVAARRPAPRPRWPFGRPRRRAVPCGVPD